MNCHSWVGSVIVFLIFVIPFVGFVVWEGRSRRKIINEYVSSGDYLSAANYCEEHGLMDEACEYLEKCIKIKTQILVDKQQKKRELRETRMEEYFTLNGVGSWENH